MIDGTRWSLMLMLLTLDGVRPFFGAMGLHMPEPMVPTLRQVALEHARPDDPTKPSMFVPDALTALAKELGDPTCGALVEWARFVFTYDDTEHLDHRRWGAVLDGLAPDEQTWATLGLRERLSEPARERWLAEAEREREEELHEDVAAEPLTDWDVCCHVLRGFVPDEDDPAANDPARWIRDTTQMRRSREFWAWLLDALPEQAQLDLLEAAEPHSPDPLRHPRVLVRLPDGRS